MICACVVVLHSTKLCWLKRIKTVSLNDVFHCKSNFSGQKNVRRSIIRAMAGAALANFTAPGGWGGGGAQHLRSNVSHRLISYFITYDLFDLIGWSGDF